MKFIFTCCLLFVVTSCFKVKEEATIGASRSPEEYRWLSIPQEVYFADDLASAYQTDSASMIAAWNSTSLVRSFLTNEGKSDFGYSSLEAITNDQKNTIYLIDQIQMPRGSQAALAVTVLMGRVNKNGQYIIEEADILIRNNAPSYDPQTIIIHELGHLLGLQHVDKSTARKLSVMYPSIESGETKHAPTILDVKALARLYNIPYGSTPSSPRRAEVPAGSGDLTRMIFELGADKTCRHLIDGVLVHSHEVNLQ